MNSSVMEENILKKVMKHVPMGLVVSREGRKRKVYYINQMAHEMLGYTREEYIQKVEGGWSKFMDLDLKDIIRDYHEKIMAGEPFEVTAPAMKKNGDMRWLLLQVVIRMELEPVSYVTMLDVTDRMEESRRQAREREYLRECASRDSMTRLLNRGTMESLIQRKLERAGDGAYAYITLDIDNFKQINDIYGHWVGDGVILGLSGILSKQFGGGAYVGRMGGDEFAVFLTEANDREAIRRQAQEVLRELRQQKERMGLSEEPSASIGIAFYPEGGTSFQELYHRADEALYQVKKEKKNGVAVYA